MDNSRRRAAVAKVMAVVFFALALLSVPSMTVLNSSLAESEFPWSNAAEAEAARIAAEEKARVLGQTYAQLSAAADKAEEDADEADEKVEKREKTLKKAKDAAEKATAEEKAEADQKVAEAEESLKKAEQTAEKKRAAAEEAREEADACYQELVEAAMILKEATEAAAQLARADAISDDKITASFSLGERYRGQFNDKMEAIYLRFHMEKDSKVQISTTDAKISITVLDENGNTILTLVPSSTGKGSICSLEECEYTMLVSPMGEEEKNFSIIVMEYYQEDDDEDEEDDDDEFYFDDDDEDFDETEMELLEEFDD